MKNTYAFKPILVALSLMIVAPSAFSADKPAPKVEIVLPAPVLGRIMRSFDREAVMQLTHMEITTFVTEQINNLTDQNGRITKVGQDAIYAFEKKYRRHFDQGAAQAFQTAVATVGAKMKGKIEVPEITTPLWQRDPGPFEHFKSTPELPTAKVDYTVIGMGIGGGSAMLNLAGEIEKGKSVVGLEMGAHPAAGASGSNGGNIELTDENFLKDYRGYIQARKDFIEAMRAKNLPKLSDSELTEQAVRQAKILLRFYQGNLEVLKTNVATYGIQADVSLAGWLRMAANKQEESHLAGEVELAKSLGLNFEVWSKEKIKAETGIEAKYSGRYIKDSGNMHPFKYTQGLVKAALDKGAQLYTDTKVERLEKQADGSYLIFTNNGVVHTQKVIITTNGYTQAILPELKAIQPWISHILNYKHTLNQMQGMTFTARQGDIYFNFPKQDWYVDADGFLRGTLHQGGGRDTPIDPKLIDQFPFDQYSFEIIHKEANEVTPDTRGRPPERAWSGIMGFTPDRLPVISFRYTYEKVNGKRQIVEDKNLIIVSADSGYGGSKLSLAGRVGAQMAITGEIPRDIIPDDMFSNLRFMRPDLMPRLAKGVKAPDVPPVDVTNLYSSIFTRAAAADICVSLFGN